MGKLINFKHEQVAKHYAKGILDPERSPSQTDAYNKVYVDANPNTARSASAVLFNRPEVKTRVAELLTESGVPLERLLAKYNELLDADKEVIDGRGKIRKLKDNPTRLECLKIGLKMHGALSDGVDVDVRSLTFNIDTVSAERLSAVIAELSALGGGVDSPDHSKAGGSITSPPGHDTEEGRGGERPAVSPHDGAI